MVARKIHTSLNVMDNDKIRLQNFISGHRIIINFNIMQSFKLTKSDIPPGTIFGFVLLIILFIFIVGLIVSDATDDNSSSNPATQLEQDLSSYAFVISQNFITSTLKAPSTADFPFLDFTAENLGNNRYKVTSYVDSQNGFGAMIRSNWQTVLKYNSGDTANPSSWILEKMIFDGEVVYTTQ
jgi:hypothetical protein